MLDSTKIVHIVLPLCTTQLQIYFVFLLIDPLSLQLLYLFFQICIFVLHALRIYAVFHFQPKLLTNNSADVEFAKVVECKRNTERMIQLKAQIKREESKRRRETLCMQYAEIGKKYSFCEICELVRPPSAIHCVSCGKCILEQRFHCGLINMCVGLSNQQCYLSYLLASKLHVLHMLGWITILGWTELSVIESFKHSQQTVMLLHVLLLLGFLQIYWRRFFSLLRKINVERREGKISYIECVRELLKCHQVGDYNQWIEELE